MVEPAGSRPYDNHWILKDLFDSRECERVIEIAESFPTEAAALEGDGGGLDETLRSATISWIPRVAETEWIYHRLERAAEKANEHYDLDLSGLGEDLQYTVYGEPGSFYTWHQDGLDGDVATRKLSLVVQLSDPADYDGSQLEFLDVAEDWDDAERDEWFTENQSRGTVIAFPAFEQHRVRPLLSGVRRSLVCWVSGPPFR